MTHKTYMQLVTLIFSIIAILHGARLLYGWNVTVGTYTVPTWLSILALLLALFLASKGWKLSKRT